MFRRGAWAVNAVVFAFVLLMSMASSANAHNELETAYPADGATIDALPAEGRMVFTQEVVAGGMTIKAGTQELPVHLVPGKRREVTFDLTGVEATPTVDLTWSILDSHDGHVGHGVTTIHLTSSDASSAPATPAKGLTTPNESRVVGVVALSARILGYLALTVIVGGLLFVSAVWPAGASDRRTRALLGAAGATGLVASITSMLMVIQRGDMPVAELLSQDYGRAAVAMVLLWVLATVVIVGVLQLGEKTVHGLPWRVGALFVAAGLIRTSGINAHATQGGSPSLGTVADFIHLAAVSAWVGGLIVMLVGLLPRRQLEELEVVTPKFSRIAMISVLLIVVSGLVLVWEISRSVDGFWSTHYSRVLIVKLVIVGLVMLAALTSKRWVEKRLAAALVNHHGAAVRSFTISVAAETALISGVLAVTSALVTSSPGV